MTGMMGIRAWKQTVLKPSTFISLGNVGSRILSEGAYQISIWLQVHTADLGRECTILDLKVVVLLIQKKVEEVIQTVVFALTSYLF